MSFPIPHLLRGQFQLPGLCCVHTIPGYGMLGRVVLDLQCTRQVSSMGASACLPGKRARLWGLLRMEQAQETK